MDADLHLAERAAFAPDRRTDPEGHVLGTRVRGRPALAAEDLLQLALEVSPIQAGGALHQVLGEVEGPVGGELPVDEGLDLGQDLVTADLGQVHAPAPRPTTASPGPFFP